MKELSIEEKAKAYDEALERMKSWERGEHPECFTEAQKAAEFIFPELKESGDERIRKVLIDYFKNYKTQEEIGIKTFFGIPTDSIIAWLEKQKEPESSKDLSDYIAELSKQFPEVSFAKLSRIAVRIKNWLEKQAEKKHKFIIGDIISNGNVTYRVDNIVKNAIGQDCYFLVNESEKDGTRYFKLTDSEGKTHNSGEITWLCEQVDANFEKKFVVDFKAKDWYVSKVDGKIHNAKFMESSEKQGEQIEINPSEFDLRLNRLLKQFESLPKEELANSLSFYLNVVQNDGTYKADKKQGEQKPAWSEEDKDMLENILGTYKTLEDMLDLSTEQDQDILTSMNFERDWLKSLKQRIGG